MGDSPTLTGILQQLGLEPMEPAIRELLTESRAIATGMTLQLAQNEETHIFLLQPLA
jgi:hypothetical protein